MAKEKEIWRDIPGYEGMYQASNLGRIKSLERYVKKVNRLVPECIRKTSIAPNGYEMLRLNKDGNKYTWCVHRLVLMAFEGVKEGFMIDHINRDKLDNRLENLRYCTRRDNSANSSKKTKSGITGVWVDDRNKNKIRYTAAIRIKGVITHLGVFETAEEAGRAYQEKKKELEKKLYDLHRTNKQIKK